jgi:prevent-host-death family protein
MAKGASTLKTIPALVARNEFGTILKRVKGNKERFVVSRKGEAAAVILGYEDFVRSILRIKEPVNLRKIREEARRSGASKLTLKEINAEIRAAREGRGGATGFLTPHVQGGL